MSSAFPGLSRSQLKKASNKQYFLIYEGECTEKEYFDGISTAADDSKLDLIITPKEIERSEADWFETDIIKLIEMSNSFIKTLKNKKFHYIYFFNIVFEPLCHTKRMEFIKKDRYSEYNDYLTRDIQPFRSKLLTSMNNKGYISSSGFIKDLDNAVQYCRSEIRRKYKFDILGKIIKLDISNKNVFSQDNVCIIHDRDYSERYFNDIKYMRAIGKINELCDKNEEKYRLIITYPKFELWLVLHVMKYSEIQTLNLDYLKLYSGPNSCPVKDKARTGPSQYVSELFQKYLKIPETKHISSLFDSKLLPGIENAIINSQHPLFKTEISDLMTEPGTNMGILMQEIIASHED
ncbi:RloB-like protein [methanogenic archaeon mixed culture ISO4-G1]|nr:RloB-like protein [methanogenic archaeon mixed culture ISO4-G1]